MNAERKHPNTKQWKQKEIKVSGRVSYDSKKPSIFEGGTYTEDPTSRLDTLLKSDVLKRKGSPNTGEVSYLRELFNLTDEAIQLWDTHGRVIYKSSPTGYGRVFAGKGLIYRPKGTAHSVPRQIRGLGYGERAPSDSMPVIATPVPRQSGILDVPTKILRWPREIYQRSRRYARRSRGDAKQLFITLINEGSYTGC